MDKHVHITIQEALYAAGIELTQVDYFGLEAGGAALENATAFLTGLNAGTAAAASPGADFNVCKRAAMGTVGAVAGIMTKINEGKWLPIEVVIARPFIEHLMMSAVMTVSGRDTGSTLFGPADMCARPRERPPAHPPRHPRLTPARPRLAGRSPPTRA
jgi:hypothetical protein